MNRAQILDTAKQCVQHDRNLTHGEPKDSFGTIAAYWSAHLDTDIKPHDVAVMLNLMKCARVKTSPANPDHWIDGAGYMGLGGELATGTPTPQTRAETPQPCRSCGDSHLKTKACTPPRFVAVTGTLTPEQRRDLHEAFEKPGAWGSRMTPMSDLPLDPVPITTPEIGTRRIALIPVEVQEDITGGASWDIPDDLRHLRIEAIAIGFLPLAISGQARRSAPPMPSKR